MPQLIPTRRTWLTGSSRLPVACDTIFTWLPGCLVAWLVGWLVGWLAGWLVGWLVGWLPGCLVGWLVGWLVGSFVCSFVGCLVACLVVWFVGSLVGSLVAPDRLCVFGIFAPANLSASTSWFRSTSGSPAVGRRVSAAPIWRHGFEPLVPLSFHAGDGLARKAPYFLSDLPIVPKASNRTGLSLV